MLAQSVEHWTYYTKCECFPEVMGSNPTVTRFNFQFSQNVFIYIFEKNVHVRCFSSRFSMIQLFKKNENLILKKWQYYTMVLNPQNTQTSPHYPDTEYEIVRILNWIHNIKISASKVYSKSTWKFS